MTSYRWIAIVYTAGESKQIPGSYDNTDAHKQMHTQATAGGKLG